MDSVHDGGCLCGAVRYRVAGRPRDVGYCHCSLCRRASGTPVTAWATFPAAAFAFTAGAPVVYRSSPQAQREFCGRCGTQLAFRYGPDSGEVDITVASLDDPASLPPQYHIWTESRLPWFDTADALPRHSRRGPDSPPP